MLKRRREQRMFVARKLLREVLVPMVQKNPQHSHNKKFQQELKQKNTTPFKKKKKNKEKENCFTYGKPGHYAKDCPDGKWKPKKKFANMIEADGGTSGYDNLLHIVL
jgi:hypothetical protein